MILIILMLNQQRILNFLQKRQEQREIDFKKRTNLDLWKLNKLSPGITLFGKDQFQFTNPEFYFDDKFLYVIKQNKPVVKHEITNIIEVRKTIYTKNNYRIWKVIVNELDSKTEYKVLNNLSLLNNNNFSIFLDRVNQNENSEVDSEFLL